MEHSLQSFKVAALASSGALAILCLGPGCILPPEITPEPVEINYPPYIDRDFIIPQEEVVLFENRAPKELRVTKLLDPNPEGELYYAWFGRNLGLITESNVLPEPEAQLVRGIYNAFEGTAVSIDPCDARLAGVEREVIWLYVSDRDWEQTGSGGVFEQENQYKVAHTWVLEFNVFCGIN